MFEWSLIGSSPVTVGDDRWAGLAVPDSAQRVALGVRLLVPEETPASWNTGGYYGLVEGIAGRGTVSETRVLPLIGRGAGQSITLITNSTFDLLPVPRDSLFAVFSAHKWMLAGSIFELWDLRDI